MNRGSESLIEQKRTHIISILSFLNICKYSSNLPSASYLETSFKCFVLYRISLDDYTVDRFSSYKLFRSNHERKNII